MDEMVARSLAKWPNVPAVYGWLELDRRGNWLIKGQRIGNPALRDFIARNYEPDERGRWYFQNGPQRVYARLERAPLVFRLTEGGFVDHCGEHVGRSALLWIDPHGTVVVRGSRGVGILDDRDLLDFSERLVGPDGHAVGDGLESASRPRIGHRCCCASMASV